MTKERLTLKEFVETHILPNTLIRLWYQMDDGGFESVIEDFNKEVSMEWELLKEKGIYKDFINSKVLGVKDIFIREGHYSEAINIVIKK